MRNPSNLDTFLPVAMRLINETKQYKEQYTNQEYSQILALENLAKTNRERFVKEYKKISGATNWDLPAIIYAYSEED